MLWQMTLLRGLKCTYQCSDWMFCGHILSQPHCVCVLMFAIHAYFYFHTFVFLCVQVLHLQPLKILFRTQNKRSINPGMVTSGTHSVCLCVCGSSFMACGFTQYSYWSLTEDCFFLLMP